MWHTGQGAGDRGRDATRAASAAALHLLLFGQAAHPIKLGVGHHGAEAGHAVAQAKKGGDGGDIPNVFVVEPVRVQRGEVGVVYQVAVGAHLHGEVEHGALAWRDVGFAVVDGDLVGDQRFLFVDAQNRAVRHHAIQAVVGRAGGGDDHLAVTLGQVAVAAHRLGHHQGIVVGKERTPFGRAAGERQKYIGHKACLFLHLQNLDANVIGQIFQLGVGVSAHVFVSKGFVRLGDYPWR